MEHTLAGGTAHRQMLGMMFGMELYTNTAYYLKKKKS